MKKHNINQSEVLAYLEDMIQLDLATDSEQEAYQDMKWFNKMSKNTYNTIVKKMQQEWNNKF